MKAFDDPYTLLAYTLVAENNVPYIYRMMVDSDYIKKLIIKETRGQDFSGPFLDTIIQEILDDKRRMEMMGELDKLADYFWNNLDLERLRGEMVEVCRRCGILDDVKNFSKNHQSNYNINYDEEELL